MLIDSHCHLDFPELAGEIDAVLARARAAGVGAMVTIGTSLRDFDRVRAIAEAHAEVWCTIGLHPHEAAQESPERLAERLIHEAEHPKLVGIGETGLDYHYEHSPRAAQQSAFRAHIAAARATGLPLVVHSRAADADTIAILREEMGQGAFTGLIHCFSSGAELACAALDLGLMISFSGILTFKKADELRAVAREVPLDSVLVETDAPYLAPVPKRGKANEPAFLVHTAAQLAALHGLDLDEIAAQTSANARRVFRRLGPPS
jgi:TatD DNase family protein